jgi:hypothetical protein
MAFLTGAFVRGSNQQIDIFIIGDMNKSQLARIVVDMEKEMNRELNYAALTVEDYDYRRNLNDRFLTDILDENKIILCDKIGVFPNSKESKEAAAETEDETTKVSVQSEEKPK